MPYSIVKDNEKMPKKDREPGTRTNGGEQMEGETQFQWFNPAMVKYNSTVLFIGPRKAGKTTAAVQLLLSAHKPQAGFVQCGSPDWKKTWSKKIPIVFIQKGKRINDAFYAGWMGPQDDMANQVAAEVDAKVEKWKARSDRKLEKEKKKALDDLAEVAAKEKWDTDKAERRMKRVVDAFEEKSIAEERKLEKKKEEEEDRLSEPESIFCVLDDMGDTKDAMEHPRLVELIDMGRHYLAMTIVIVQYLVSFPAKCRGGVDWVFIWGGSLTADEMKKFINMYIPEQTFPTKRAALRAFRSITGGNSDEEASKTCMVIWRTGPSKAPRNCVFKWNARSSARGNRKTLIGDPDYRLYSDLYYNGAGGQVPSTVLAKVRAEEKKQKRVPAATIGAAASAPASATVAKKEMTKEEYKKRFGEFVVKRQKEREAGDHKLDARAVKKSNERWRKADKQQRKAALAAMTSGTPSKS